MSSLFNEFNKTTPEAWKDQIIKDLKGIDFNELIWKTNSGIDVKPFYTKEDIEIVEQTKSLLSDWSICEYINVTDEKTANKKALNALQNGASGLVFKISQKTNFEILCHGILFEHIYCLFETSKEFEKELTSFIASKNFTKFCFIECDTILSGEVNINQIESVLAINTSDYNESGANTTNQLAFSISHINDYLHELSLKDKLINLKTLHITASVGGDFFMEIAKLRALRKLTIFLLKQYNLEVDIHIHSKTTLVNKSSIDIYNNLLRSTTEIMSACIGGSNSIVVLPFDYGINSDNDFSSRMARNQQLILKDESYLDKVSDLSSGSYYIESITKTLCQKAWDLFKEIEAKGGLVNSLKLNYIQNLINEDAEKLIADFKSGKLILVGVNKFQNKLEDSKSNQNTIINNVTKSLDIKPIKELRLANIII